MIDISKKVLDNIQDQHIEPKSRWHFLWRRVVVWGMAVLATILGSIAVAVILFYVTDMDWDIQEDIPENFLGFALTNLPYFWILFALLFIAAGYYYIHHTRKGYRYGFWSVGVGCLVVSLAGGLLLHSLGTGDYVDDMASRHVPFYEQMLNTREKRWHRPEAGMLGGKIIQLSPDTLLLQDRQGKIWTINITKIQKPAHLILKENISIRVIGHSTGGELFEAEIIRPWLLRKPRPEGRIFLIRHLPG